MTAALSAPAVRAALTPQPGLVAVAHGSRDPHSAATVTALVDEIRALRPDLDVSLAFLELSAPRIEPVLSRVGRAVVVPLLLGRAHHARVDVPGAVAETVSRRPGIEAVVADVLGPHPLLERVAIRRLEEAGVDLSDPGTGIVLAAAGSSKASSTDAVVEVARRWSASRGGPVVAAFAAAAEPTVPDAVAALRAAGCRRVGVASWFLAPGRLSTLVSRQAAAAEVVFAAPLGADPDVARVICERYDECTVPRSAVAIA